MVGELVDSAEAETETVGDDVAVVRELGEDVGEPVDETVADGVGAALGKTVPVSEKTSAGKSARE